MSNMILLSHKAACAMLAAAALVFSHQTHATTIVGIATPDGYVMAADGKVTHIRANGGEYFTETRKLYAVGKILFGITGYVPDGSHGIVLPSFISEFLAAEHEHASMTASNDKLHDKLAEIAKHEATVFRRENSELWAKVFTDREFAIQVLLAWFEDDRLRAMRMKVSVVFDESGSAVTTKSGEECSDDGNTALLGHTTAIEAFLEKNGPLRMLATDAAPYLVQVEIDAGDPSIGPPVSVAVLSKHGVQFGQYTPSQSPSNSTTASP